MNMEQYSDAERLEKMKSMLSEMLVFMESYRFRDYINNRYVDGYNFYDVKNQVDMTMGNIDLCRQGCEIAFLVWRECIRKIGATLPTSIKRESVFTKITMKLFNPVASTIDVAAEERLYLETCSKYKMKDNSNFNRLMFLISRMMQYDLPFNGIVLARARGSKSTLTATAFEKFYKMRGTDIYTNKKYETMLNTQFILDDGSAIVNGAKGQFNWFDDVHLIFDRRRSMSRKQAKDTGDLNFYASMNYVNFYLMQNLASLDSRITTISNVLFLIIERGTAMVFSDAKWLPFFYDRFGFDVFEDNPDIAKNKELALKILESKNEYMCTIRWRDRKAHTDNNYNIIGAEDDPFYAYVLGLKLKKQIIKPKADAKTIDEIVNALKEQDINKKEAILKLHAMGTMTQQQIADLVKSEQSYVGMIVGRSREAKRVIK